MVAAPGGEPSETGPRFVHRAGGFREAREDHAERALRGGTDRQLAGPRCGGGEREVGEMVTLRAMAPATAAATPVVTG
jgi:hypothetical protein